MYKKLYRSAREGMLGGVAAGLADYFEIDPIIIRLAFVLLTLFGGAGVIIYILMWIIVPQAQFVPYNMNTNIPPQNQEAGAGTESKEAPGGNFGAGSDTTSNAAPNTGNGNDPFTDYFKSLKKQKEKRAVTVGIILVVFGIFLLANSLFHQIYFHDIFPVALIVLGIGLLLNAIKK